MKNLPLRLNRARSLFAAVCFGVLGTPAAFSIVAGDPNLQSNPDSPDLRIDPNTMTSLFAGVGSITAVDELGNGTFLCTATPITSRHILTAAHCITDDFGNINLAPENVRFFLNFGGSITSSISAVTLTKHPDWRGFSTSVFNDIAVITLSQDCRLVCRSMSCLGAPFSLHRLEISVQASRPSPWSVMARAGLGRRAVRRIPASIMFRHDSM
jgi:hypothetical protein